jgi:hypothetical protein
MEDSVVIEENGYPVSDPNKTMISVSKEPSDTHTRTHAHTHTQTLKEEILEEIWLTRHGQLECARCTQEISTHQK